MLRVLAITLLAISVYLTLCKCGVDTPKEEIKQDSRARRDFKVPDGFYERFKEDGNRPLCGDHICNGSETWRSCWVDCTPQKWNFNPPMDPGWVDPINSMCYKKGSVYFWIL